MNVEIEYYMFWKKRLVLCGNKEISRKLAKQELAKL